MLLIVVYCLFVFTPTANDAFNCHLPDGCRLERGLVEESYNMIEITDRDNYLMIMCDINKDEFRFKFKNPPTFVQNERCLIAVNSTNKLILRWTSKDSTILDIQFNFTSIFTYLINMKYTTDVHLWNLKGFDLNFLGEKPIVYRSGIGIIEFSNCRLDFYHERRKINSCDDILNSNLTYIMSIFQVRSANSTGKVGHVRDFVLRNIEYKRSICPLVFNNSDIAAFVLVDLTNTFYKRNVLSFENETFSDLKPNIKHLQLHKLRNVNLDLNLLHPSVFNQTIKLSVLSGSLNSIDGEIFRNLRRLLVFEIDSVIFRKLVHKQSIEWIRQWNLGVDVDVTKIKENTRNRSLKAPKDILLTTIYKNTRKKLSTIFPDADFCLYVDFPFNQFLIIYEEIQNEITFTYKESELTCTYLWLAQYFKYYYNYYFSIHKSHNSVVLKPFMRILNTTAFKSISKCNFEERIGLCNKSTYQLKDIWDESDIFILSKKMQIAFKIILYPTALLGFITNIIVFVVILKKENTDLFKEFKQYSYLYLNSLFCIIIMVIELFSWMTECFYPFEAFCPEIRKLVPIQFFKIIFKECLITMSRFMCSFTYVAFSLNRIGLIGKDHGKLVTFFSELGIKVFIGVTLLISSSLSWIKGFKYEVNYFYPFLNYPISTEMDISMIDSNSLNDAYFIFNFICDLFNYVVFVVICVIIDICMVVQLRRVLEEKTKKIGSVICKAIVNNQNESKKEENNENVVNKAIKMVVLNSVIGIFFKLPASFIPLLNVVAEFYYKDKMNKYIHPSFGEFYSLLHITEIYSLIHDISYFLYTLSLSIQIFIYNRFDKKFQAGFERLWGKAFSYIKNLFKKSDNENS